MDSDKGVELRFAYVGQGGGGGVGHLTVSPEFQLGGAGPPAVAFGAGNFLVNMAWWVTRVSIEGIVLDSPATQVVSSGAWSDVTFDGENFLVVSAQAGVVAARVSPAGRSLAPGEFAITTQDAYWTPKVAFNGAHFLTVWPGIQSSGVPAVFGARLDASGTVVDAPPVAIAAAPFQQRDPAVAANGSGFLVAWQDFRRGYGIAAARVTDSGQLLDPSGIVLWQGGGNLLQPPAVASDGQDFLVVWSALGGDGTYDVFGANVDSSGTAAAPFVISSRPADQTEPAVTLAGQTYLVCWDDLPDGRMGFLSDIYCARVSKKGIVLDTEGVAVATGGLRLYPQVACGPGRCLVVWEGHAASGVWRDAGAILSGL